MARKKMPLVHCASPLTPWRSKWSWLCAALTLLKLWLGLAQTASAIAPALRDDGLFLSHAETILRGEWLGPLTDLTLVKGPIYPLWLAAIHLTGLPLLLSQALLYTIACAVLVIAVCPILGPPWARAMLYMALLFNPSSWANGPATRITRDGFYSSVTLLLLATAVGLVLRLREGPKASMKWAISTGLTGAALAMTREEGLWVVPSLLLLFSLGLIRAWRSGWRSWAAPAALAAAAYLVPVVTVATVNRVHYGLFTTCEMTADYFQAAYGALTRVKTDNWNPYVPVPEEARRRIYEVSPAFREIGLNLEGSVAGWAIHGCKAFGVCDDIAGGWFVWAFREAVTAAGKYRDGGGGARAWYNELAHEIDDACRTGALDCLPSRKSLASPWHEAYLRPLLSTWAYATAFLVTYDSVSPRSSPAYANESDLRRYEEMTHERIPLPLVRLSGELASHASVVRAWVSDPKDDVAEAKISSRILASYGAESSSSTTLSRYEVETSCVEECRLYLATGQGPQMVVPISAEAGDRVYKLGDWQTDSFVHDSAEAPTRTATARIAILETITHAYGLVMPVLLVVALVLVSRRMWLGVRARVIPDVTVLAMALIGAVLVRLLLLAVISVSAFPAVIVLYCAPAYALCVASVALVLLSEAAEALRHGK